MKWKGRRQSSNVEDHRRSRGGGGRKMATKGGIGTIIIIIIASFILGENPLTLLQQFGGTQSYSSDQSTDYAPASAEEEEMAQFSKVVFADTEDVWNELLDGYQEPTMRLFTDQVQSACGHATAATGPFYCGADRKIYIDLAFFEELHRRFGAPGDFAQAYVIAHEVGHHIQNLMGITGKVHQMKGRVSEEEYNDQSVRLELQADFLAGVWAHHAHKMKNILESGDIEEALGAASAIGDDRLQMQARGYVVPESFTHGTSEQRMRWFKKGLETGDINQGNTFSVANL